MFGLMADANQAWEIPLTAAVDAPISAKLGGVIAMFGSIALLFLLPWLDNHPVRSARFRPLFRIFVILFTLSVIILGYAGSQPSDKVYWSTCFGDTQLCEAIYQDHTGSHADALEKVTVLKFDNTMLAQIFTGFYFFFFLVILPLLSRFEKGRELPVSIHQAVMDKHKKAGA